MALIADRGGEGSVEEAALREPVLKGEKAAADEEGD